MDELLFDEKNKKQRFIRKFVKYYLVLFLIFFAFLVGLFIGYNSIDKYNQQVYEKEYDYGQVYNKKEKPEYLSEDVNFDLFWQVWDTISANYVNQPVNETELLYGAMAGMVASLGDPHSIFLDPQITSDFTEELRGSFEGIGAEIAIKKDQLIIVAPLPGSPAEQAGLRSGDKILAIDGEDTFGISLDYAVNQIRGPKGTDVILTISRNGIDEAKEITITRGTIEIKSVTWQELDNGLIHLELRYFNDDTYDDLNKAIVEITAQNPKGIILDLRNNPGGYLDVAIDVAGEWVEDDVVVIEKYSSGEIEEHRSNGRARLKDFPAVVLINQGSASGSEIVAGALQDYGLAELIGETSFGKGSVQSLFPVGDGSSVKLTIAAWLTPKENEIDGVGIDPDIEVELTDEDWDNDRDPQLDKAIEFLSTNPK